MTSPDRQGTRSGQRMSIRKFCCHWTISVNTQIQFGKERISPRGCDTMVLGPIFMAHPVTFQVEQAASFLIFNI